jgi:hypothetical protein
MKLSEAIDEVEKTYEFMLAYAAQGRANDEDTSRTGIRAELTRLVQALGVIGSAELEGEAARIFLDVMRQDAAKAAAAIGLVLSKPGISSQAVDNLNASIHIRALLTDLFILDETLKITEA